MQQTHHARNGARFRHRHSSRYNIITTLTIHMKDARDEAPIVHAWTHTGPRRDTSRTRQAGDLSPLTRSQGDTWRGDGRPQVRLSDIATGLHAHLLGYGWDG